MTSSPSTARRTRSRGEDRSTAGGALSTAGRAVRLRAGALAERVRMSLWFLPGLSSLCAIALAHTLSALDEAGLLAESGWYLYGGQADSARSLLSTIATSVMSLTGVVFSITVLVLQLASNQFSPRVLRTFLGDRLTQLAMGTFLGSFVYAIVLLSEVRERFEGQAEFVPRLAVFGAYVAVLLSIGVFVRYIHHMAHSIRAVSLIRRIADETRRCLLRELEGAQRRRTREESAQLTMPPDLDCINTGAAGVVSAVDIEALCAAACRHDAVIALVHHVGDFVPRGAPLARVWNPGEGIERVVADAVVLQDERTVRQDPAFGFRQLVDIAERALSPGVNDPTTAVQVLDQLHDLLRAMVCRDLPRATHFVEGKLRLIVPRLEWEGYVRLAFEEIRLYGSNSVQVVRRLTAALDDLTQLAPPERAGALRRELDLLRQTAET